MALSQQGARRLHLAAQGLGSDPVKSATKRDVLAATRRMTALQIDTISVVARSPYFVLWSRLGRYRPEWLDELLVSGKLFEYWAHAACFIPIELYPLFRPDMLHGHKRTREWIAKHKDVVDHVRSVIQARGNVRSSDFKGEPTGSGWWGWKPEKVALEVLFTTGEIMISRRVNFQRIYAPTQTVLGREPEDTLSLEESLRERLLLAVRSLGVARARWAADYIYLPKSKTPKLLRALVEEGRLLTTEVDGWNEPGLVHPENETLLKRALRGRLPAERTTFLMPFDPVMWDRQRALELFDFNYKIEVYTPTAQRKFGYLTLPILHKDRLVGRLDAKAHRSRGEFEVRAIHLENEADLTDELLRAATKALRDLAVWHGTPELNVTALGDFGAAIAKHVAASAG